MPTKAVVLVVGLLILGTAISVARYVDATQPVAHPRPSTSWAIPKESPHQQAARVVRLEQHRPTEPAPEQESTCPPTPVADSAAPRAPSLWTPQGAGG